MHKLVSQDRVAFGHEPIVLVGPPDGCEGLISLHNPSAESIKLRRVRLRSTARALSGSAGEGVLELQLAATLLSGASGVQRVSLQLPVGTPPGTYEASLEGAQAAPQPVQIEVLEQRRTMLSPSAITQTVWPGRRFSVRLSAVNGGNVPVEIPRFGAAVLHDIDRDWMHHFHAAAAERGADGHREFLDRFIARMGENEPPPARVRISGGGTLLPQSGRLIELAVSLPRKLRSRRAYLGRLRIADAVLELTLHVGSKPKTEPSAE